MLGAIAGDMIGSVYERAAMKRLDFPLFSQRSRFTDDTVMTIAVAHALLTGTSYDKAMRLFGRKYLQAGYGGMFYRWLLSDAAPAYGSFGNGSAMRVSAIGWARDSLEEVLLEAERSAVPTHDHPEGVKGAQAIAAGVFLLRKGMGKEELRGVLAGRFGYNLARTLSEIRPGYSFDVTCQGSVPESILAFVESESVESAIRNAVSLGGDSDTIGAMAGALAEAHYGGIGETLTKEVQKRLPDDLLAVVTEFSKRYQSASSGG